MLPGFNYLDDSKSCPNTSKPYLNSLYPCVKTSKPRVHIWAYWCNSSRNQDVVKRTTVVDCRQINLDLLHCEDVLVVQFQNLGSVKVCKSFFALSIGNKNLRDAEVFS